MTKDQPREVKMEHVLEKHMDLPHDCIGSPENQWVGGPVPRSLVSCLSPTLSPIRDMRCILPHLVPWTGYSVFGKADPGYLQLPNFLFSVDSE